MKGFGYKTQEDIKHKIEFFLSSSGKYHYASVEGIANELVESLKISFPQEKIEITGNLRRKMPIVESIELIATIDLIPHIQSLSENEDHDRRHIKTSPFQFYVLIQHPLVLNGLKVHVAKTSSNH